jgi:hypothetical protein
VLGKWELQFCGLFLWGDLLPGIKTKATTEAAAF